MPILHTTNPDILDKQGVHLFHFGLSSCSQRVRFALEQGCTAIHTCTGEAVPGDPQHSYNNIKRCGFRETDLLVNWAPPKE